MPAEPHGRIAMLRALVSRPYAVEILDALDSRPLSRSEVCARTRLLDRRVARALQDLAAEGMVTRVGAAGTWDSGDAGSTRYTLTAAGRAAVRELNSLEVWNRIFEAFERGDR